MMSIRLLMLVCGLPPATPVPPSMLYPVIMPVYMVVLVSYTRSMLRVRNHAMIKAINGNIVRYQRMRYRNLTKYLNVSMTLFV